MANSKRGEHEFELDGEKHVLRYSMGAIRELEEHFECKMAEMQQKLVAGVGAADTMTLLVAGLKRGSMPDATVEIVEEMVVMGDLPKIMKELGVAMGKPTTAAKSTAKSRRDQKPEKETPTHPAGTN